MAQAQEVSYPTWAYRVEEVAHLARWTPTDFGNAHGERHNWLSRRFPRKGSIKDLSREDAWRIARSCAGRFYLRSRSAGEVFDYIMGRTDELEIDKPDPHIWAVANAADVVGINSARHNQPMPPSLRPETELSAA